MTEKENNPFFELIAKQKGISYEEAEKLYKKEATAPKVKKEKIKRIQQEQPEVVNCINCRYLPKKGYGECENPENKKMVKMYRKVISSAESDTCVSFAPKIASDSKPKVDINAKIDSILALKTFRTARDSEIVYLFKPELGYYVRGESYITEICANDYDLNQPTIQARIKMIIKGKTYREREVFEQHLKMINLKNGTLDTDKMELLPHNPDYFFLNRVEVDFIPDAECPLFDNMLKYALPNEKDRLQLQEWFGYHFMSGQPLEKSMFLLGKRDTGRSTLISILNALLGNCCCHHQLHEFDESSQYATADLYGKLANTYTDLGQTTIKDVGKFKVLTGSKDSVSSRMPYERPFNFINPAKLTFACNKLPPLGIGVQQDMAFWKRVLLIVFENTVKKENMDVHLGNKILQQELPGVLNWSIEGYKRLVQNNAFTKNTEDVTDLWINSAYVDNPLEQFLEECATFGVGEFAYKEQFKTAYLNWCKFYEVLNPADDRTIKLSLMAYRIFPGRHRIKTDKGNEEKHIWKGINIHKDYGTSITVKVEEADESIKPAPLVKKVCRECKVDIGDSIQPFCQICFDKREYYQRSSENSIQIEA